MTQLYPLSRIEQMSVDQMNAVVRFTRADLADPGTVYCGMTREETVTTASRTIRDLTAALDRAAVRERAMKSA